MLRLCHGAHTPHGIKLRIRRWAIAWVAGSPLPCPLRGFVPSGSAPGAQAAYGRLLGARRPGGRVALRATARSACAKPAAHSIAEGLSPAPLPSPPPPLVAPGKREASLAGCGPPRHIWRGPPGGVAGFCVPLPSPAASHCTGAHQGQDERAGPALMGPVKIVGAGLDKCEHLCYIVLARPVSGANALRLRVSASRQKPPWTLSRGAFFCAVPPESATDSGAITPCGPCAGKPMRPMGFFISFLS